MDRIFLTTRGALLEASLPVAGAYLLVALDNVHVSLGDVTQNIFSVRPDAPDLLSQSLG